LFGITEIVSEKDLKKSYIVMGYRDDKEKRKEPKAVEDLKDIGYML
jgi:hypothetical protein